MLFRNFEISCVVSCSIFMAMWLQLPHLDSLLNDNTEKINVVFFG